MGFDPCSIATSIISPVMFDKDFACGDEPLGTKTRGIANNSIDFNILESM